jgi:hypothetical protein
MVELLTQARERGQLIEGRLDFDRTLERSPTLLWGSELVHAS